MNDEQLAALKNVVRNTITSEQRHYQDQSCPKDHIFLSLATLHDYLEDEMPTQATESTIGIVRDPETHAEDPTDEQIILWRLQHLANLPDAVSGLVSAAVELETAELRQAAKAALDAVHRCRNPEPEIPI